MQKSAAFTGRDSYARLQQLQGLCEDDGYDALLLVGGADGLFSHGSQAALKYLFLGKSGQELLGEQVIPQQYESLEEVIVLLTRRTVSIFYILDSDSATFLLPFLSCWRNVSEFVATDDMPQDVRELTKIRAFRDMIEPYGTIGVPLNTTVDPKMTAEKWPIIQSFGLDDISSKGFFTMHHNVVNSSTSLTQRMSIVDDYYARRLVTDAQPALQHHFRGFLEKLDHAENPAERATRSEMDVGDDLTSFYEFGTIRHEARGLTKAAHRGAKVLFGTRTSKLLESPSKSITPAQAGVRGFSASHFAVVAEEPLTGLRLARSYFFGTGQCAKRIVDTEALVHPTLEKLDRYDSVPSNAADTRFLIELYLGLLDVHAKIIPAFVREAKKYATGSLDAIVSSVQSLAQQLFSKVELEHADRLSSHVLVNVECLDACGEPTKFQSTPWNQIYLTLTIEAIPSLVVQGDVLGSLVVGDTVLFQRDADSDEHLIVTAAFEYFKTWIQAGQEADFASHVDDVLASDYMLDQVVRIGREIGERIAHASVLVPCSPMPVLFGQVRTLWIATKGFVLKSPHFQPLIVSFPSDVQALRILSTPHEELLLLVVDFAHPTRNPVVASLPCTPTSVASIALPLVAGSRMQESLLSVLDTWKQSATTHDIPFIKPATDDLEAIPQGFQVGCDALLDRDSQESVKARFFPQWFISKAMSQVSAWTKPKSTAKLVVPVSIFVGLPGSDARLLASTLCDVSAGNNEWHHVVVDTRELPQDADTAQLIPKRLNAALDAIQDQDNSTREHRPRILLTVVGYVDPIAICAAVKRADKLKLSTVTTVVSGLTVFQPDTANPYPKLWDQLTAGFVTAVILTHTQELSKTGLHRLRTRVDAANPFADVLCLRSNGLDGDLASLLAIDLFETSERQQYRRVHFPKWETSPSTYVMAPSHAMSAVRFEMQLSVDRARFLACIQRGLCPHTTLKAIAPIYPLAPPSTELKGLRLAQALAMEKVQQQSLSEKETAAIPDNIAAIAADCGRVWTIEATLSFTDDTLHAYSYLNTGTKSFLRALPRVSPPSQVCTIAFTGANLRADKLRQLLLQSCPARHQVVPSVRQEISLEEKRQIQAMHVTDPLPEGYMFDGTSYYDYFGGQYEFHPSIQEFVDAYLAKKNDVARRQNNELEVDRLRFEECTRQV
ncbi:Aste57867_3407 [Aphanomyces stellatus]|uniref:Aste57867_3407 protein n=1 Tax=Aphanomyces stellatus TaxID=120398 RepID=A0A485KFE0_9STRA|nr:hypothetical protein As57867_003397 [Aphanomyces stellatus]VFT80573.1 Aste57867_3407 [Aphanomyces stellatus]